VRTVERVDAPDCHRNVDHDRTRTARKAPKIPLSTPPTPRPWVHLALAGVLVALSLVPVRPGPAAAQDEPLTTFEAADCPFALPPFLEEGKTVSCGYVTVPEFHDDPEGGTIRLAVAILASTASTARNPADEPLILLNGGPGQPSEPVLPSFDPDVEGSLAGLLERQDVVLFDQRGTGYSEPDLYCATDVPPTPGGGTDEEDIPTPADVEGEVAGSFAEDAAACRETFDDQGIDLEAYTTAENAADVEDIRVALGYDQVDLLGISYGSRLALAVMRDFPDAVRSVVLASPLPPQIDQVAGQLIAFDAALTRVFDGCAADRACDRAYPNLEETFLTAIDTLEADPLPVTYEDLTTGEPVEIPIDGETFVSLVYFSVFVGPLLPIVAPLMATAEAGVPDVMEIILPFIATFGSGFSTGLQLAVNCQDEVNFSSVEDAGALIAEAGVRPEIADGTGLGDLDYYEACEALDVRPERQVENRAVESDIPTLILTGAYDPITPTLYGELALETLLNGTLVEFVNAGHDPLSTAGPCAVDIATAFLADPAAEVDASCADDLEIDFSP